MADETAAVTKAVQIVGDLLVSAWRSPLKRYLLYSLVIHVAVLGVFSAGTMKKMAWPLLGLHAEETGGETAASGEGGPASPDAAKAEPKGEEGPGEEAGSKEDKAPSVGDADTLLEGLLEPSGD